MIRGIIIYAIVFIVFRLMGKRQLGQLQPYEFVVTLIIADLATIPMSEINIPIVHGIVPLLTIALIHFLISFLSRKSIKLRRIFNGKPIIVISPNGLDYENLKELNMDFNDLCEALRELNYFSFDQIEYAIVETNGKLTVLPNAENSPVVVNDLKIKKERSALPIMLICDGRKIEENLQIANINDEFLLKNIRKAGVFKVKDILLATLDNNGKMYVQARNKKCVSFKTNYKGGDNW